MPQLIARPKAVMILAEYDEGFQVFEIDPKATVQLEYNAFDPYKSAWGWDYRYDPTLDISIRRGPGSTKLLSVTRFDKKQGKRIAWAIRRLLGGSE